VPGVYGLELRVQDSWAETRVGVFGLSNEGLGFKIWG